MRVLLFGISVFLFFYAASVPGSTSRKTRRPTRTDRRGFRVVRLRRGLFQFPAPAGFGAQYIWLRSGSIGGRKDCFTKPARWGTVRILPDDDSSGAAWAAPASSGIAPRTVSWRGGLSRRPGVSYSRGSLLNALGGPGGADLPEPEPHPVGQVLHGVGGAAGPRRWRYVCCCRRSRALIGCDLDVGRIRSLGNEGLLWGASQAGALCSSWRNTRGTRCSAWFTRLPYSDYLGRTVIAEQHVLSVLAETGIVGLGAMLWFSIQILRSARRAAGRRSATPFFRKLDLWVGPAR